VYGTHLLMAVDAALQMDAQLRPQTVGEWRQVMDKETQADAVNVEAEGTEHLGEPPEVQNTPAPSILDSVSVPMPVTRQGQKSNLTLWTALAVGANLLVLGWIMVSILDSSKKREIERQREHQRKIALLLGEKAGQQKLFSIRGKDVAFRWCPPTGEGSFIMGSPTNETDRDSDEKQHAVVLTKGFWLMETEVTQGLWKAVMGANPSHFKKGYNYPVEQVSWNDCQKFINKLNNSGMLSKGLKAALPTEAEWEYACRAGKGVAYGGTGNLDTMGWYFSNSARTTHSAGEKKANAWGLHDMHGNVSEWCADFYDRGYYDAGTAGNDPKGPSASGQYPVMRGGSFDNTSKCCRSACRQLFGPMRGVCSIGFRLSLQVDGELSGAWNEREE
jgi:hypothetical protein